VDVVGHAIPTMESIMPLEELLIRLVLEFMDVIDFEVITLPRHGHQVVS
jgi:hypothetical protein